MLWRQSGRPEEPAQGRSAGSRAPQVRLGVAGLRGAGEGQGECIRRAEPAVRATEGSRGSAAPETAAPANLSSGCRAELVTVLPLHLGLKALPFSKLRTSELRSLPLGPPSTVQHASQSPNPEGRGRTGLTEDGDASPGHASSALADLSQSPGRSVRILGEAGKSCQASGAIRGEWMSEALPLRHLDRGPARKARLAATCSANSR